MNESITHSQTAMDQSSEHVDATHSIFDQISEAAEGAENVQKQIREVVTQSLDELKIMTASLDQTQSQCNNVVQQIDKATHLGTTKSSMFEDMDNMISQIEPLLRQADSSAAGN